MTACTPLIVAICSAALATGAGGQADQAAPPVPAEPLPAPSTPDQAAASPATDRTTIAGNLAIRAVQGTKGGPAIGAVPVEVQLFHQQQPVDRIATQLDEHGVVVLEGLPAGIGITPVVKVNYGGVVYQEVGPTLGPDNRDATMDVTVYETTDDPPDWHIVMRHVLVEPRAGGGAAVSDMVIVESKADRTWLGGLPDLEGGRTAVTVAIPPGAKGVQLLEGFHGWCCTKLGQSSLAVQMPLMPGRARFHFSYEVPAQGGKTDLRVAAPKRIEQMALFIPDDGTVVESTGLDAGGTSTMGGTPVRLFSATGIEAGKPAGIVLTSTAVVHVGGNAARNAQIAALIGIGLVVLIGFALILLRRPRPRDPAGPADVSPAGAGSKT